MQLLLLYETAGFTMLKPATALWCNQVLLRPMQPLLRISGLYNDKLGVLCFAALLRSVSLQLDFFSNYFSCIY